jgi:hypothetical protein
VHEPALWVIVQGCKRVTLRDESCRYDALHYLVVSVDLPVTGQIIEATPAVPCLCLRLDLDPRRDGGADAAGGPRRPASGRSPEREGSS